MHLFSKIISIIFHPVFIPVYLLLVTFTLPVLSIQILNPLMRIVILGLLVVNNVVIPIFSFYILKNLSFTKTLQMESAEERKAPYILGFVYYAITTFIFMRTSYIDEIISFIPMAAAAILLVLFIVNYFSKISAHAASAGSAIGYFILLHLYLEVNTIVFVIGAMLIGGIIASARLKLKAHTQLELYSGYIAGLCIPLLLGYFVLF